MSRINDVRSTISKKLDAMEHQVLALEAQLTQTREQVLERFEHRKDRLRAVLKQVQMEVQKSREIHAQAKITVLKRLEHLQVQLALGKADTQDLLEEQRRKILESLKEFESSADQTLHEAAFKSGELWEDLVGRTSELHAEVEALKCRFEGEKASQQAVLESTKAEFFSKLHAFKEHLKTKREALQAKVDLVEHDLQEGLDHLKTAFRRLFD